MWEVDSGATRSAGPESSVRSLIEVVSKDEGALVVFHFSYDQKKRFIVVSSLYYSLRVRAVIRGSPTFMSRLMKSFVKSLQHGKTLTAWYPHNK